MSRRLCPWGRPVTVTLGLAVGLGLGACATDHVDLSGSYKVDLHVGSMPCGADTAIVGTPYLRFRKEELFGQPYFVFDSCNDANGIDCPTMGSLFDGFEEPLANGWHGLLSSSSASGGMCALGYQTRTAILTGAALVIESSKYSDHVALPDASCTTKEAEKRGTSMPCDAHERYETTKQ